MKRVTRTRRAPRGDARERNPPSRADQAHEPTTAELIEQAEQGDRDSALALLLRAYRIVGGCGPTLDDRLVRDYLQNILARIIVGEEPKEAMNLKRKGGRKGDQRDYRDVCYVAVVEILRREQEKGTLSDVYSESDPIGLAADELQRLERQSCSYSTVEKADLAHRSVLRKLLDEELYALAEDDEALPYIRDFVSALKK